MQREWPAEGVTRVPYWVYQDDANYRAELRRIFEGPVWNYVCLEVDLPRAGDYHGKSKAPQTAPHHVHSDQSRHQKIHVTRTGLRDPRFTNAHDVRSALASLQNIVDE